MKRKQKENAFKPNRSYIDEAVKLYLAEGGKITRIEVGEDGLKKFLLIKESRIAVDEFLNEG